VVAVVCLVHSGILGNCLVTVNSIVIALVLVTLEVLVLLKSFICRLCSVFTELVLSCGWLL
jgi:hypothetical protein